MRRLYAINTTMKKSIIPILLILFGMGTLSLHAQKEAVLRLNPNEGVTYTVNTKNTMMNLMEVQGQLMSSSQTMEFRQTFTAKERNEETITFEGQIEAIQLTISQMGMTFTYDSEHPEKTSPMLAGQTSEFDSQIKVPSLVQFDVLGHHLDTVKNAGMVESISAIIPLPEHPVQVGSSWTSKKSQNISGVDINADMTYTVTKISKKGVEVEVKGVVEGGKEVSGTYDGTASISTETGLVTSSSVKTKLSMTIEEQDLSIPLTITSATTVTLE